jgi:predicted amidohydrolase YtcJ
MAAGFQAEIHDIGDAGNRETLDFFQQVFADHPEARGQPLSPSRQGTQQSRG